MSEKIENFRLPKYAIPTRYNIELSPDLEEKKFQGKVDLSINILEETDQISVNVAELHVNSIQINSDNLKNLKFDIYRNGQYAGFHHINFNIIHFYNWENVDSSRSQKSLLTIFNII